MIHRNLKKTVTEFQISMNHNNKKIFISRDTFTINYPLALQNWMEKIRRSFLTHSLSGGWVNNTKMSHKYHQNNNMVWLFIFLLRQLFLLFSWDYKISAKYSDDIFWIYHSAVTQRAERPAVKSMQNNHDIQPGLTLFVLAVTHYNLTIIFSCNTCCQLAVHQ